MLPTARHVLCSFRGESTWQGPDDDRLCTPTLTKLVTPPGRSTNDDGSAHSVGEAQQTKQAQDGQRSSGDCAHWSNLRLRAMPV